MHSVAVADALQVLLANATPGMSHVSPAFVPVFGDCLRMLRKVLYAEKPGNQPFLIAGSGTMGWDAAGANLVEPGEDVVSISFSSTPMPMSRVWPPRCYSAYFVLV